MRPLSIFYVAACYAFQLKSQLLLGKTPKPNPVSQALIGRGLEIVGGSRPFTLFQYRQAG